MELNEYQQRAMTTCLPSSNNVAYMYLGLLGEVGELAEKMGAKSNPCHDGDAIYPLLDCGYLAKIVRKKPEHPDTKYTIALFDKFKNASDEEKALLKGECGDILWMLSGLCTVMGWKLEEIGDYNLAKLSSRQQRGVIDGSGDNR